MTPESTAAALLVLDFDGVCFDPTARDIDPAAADLVRDARAVGIGVAVLSNELDEHTRTTTPLLDDVDHVVACTTGIQKPDRRAFQRVMMIADVSPERTVVVDDRDANVRGAEAAGARAVLFDLGDRAGSWTAIRRAAGLPPAEEA